MSNYNLSELVFEDVDAQYGWGKYGDFKVLIRKKDGYINATKLCKDGGKELTNWNQNKTSASLIEEVQRSVGIPSHPLIEQVIQGPNDLRGSYVHPKLIPHIASWICPSFAVKVSDIVNDYLVREYRMELLRLQHSLGEKQDKIDQLLIQNDLLLKKVDKMDHRLAVANENIIETLDNLGVVSNERVPIPRMAPAEREQIVLLNTDGTNYKVIRAQRRAVRTAVRRQQDEFPNLRTVITLDSRPNARELWNAIRKRLRALGFEVRKNDMIISTQDEALLLRVFRECNNEKFDLFTENRGQIVRQALTDGKESEEKSLTLEEKEESSSDTGDEGKGAESAPEDDSVSLSRELWGRSCEELRQICRDRGFKRWSKMKKAELVQLICASFK